MSWFSETYSLWWDTLRSLDEKEGVWFSLNLICHALLTPTGTLNGLGRMELRGGNRMRGVETVVHM